MPQRATPEEQERLDAMNREMRAVFFEQLHRRAPKVERRSDAPPVLFVRASEHALEGSDRRFLLAQVKRAAHAVASSRHLRGDAERGFDVAWDATAAYCRQAGEPPCWRIVVG